MNEIIKEEEFTEKADRKICWLIAVIIGSKADIWLKNNY